jgi:hypothetical protein
MIVEHWDTIEAIAPREEWKSGRMRMESSERLLDNWVSVNAQTRGVSPITQSALTAGAGVQTG